MSSYNTMPGNRVLAPDAAVDQPSWELFDRDRPNKEKDENKFIHSFFFSGKMKNDRQNPDQGDPIHQIDITQIEQEAYQKGFLKGEKSGFEKGIQSAKQDLDRVIQLFQNLVQELRQEKESFYQENEFYIVKLSIEIAKKIIHRELTQNPEILLYVVREALKRITGGGRILIRVHQNDIDLLKNDHEILGNQLSAFEHVDFVPVDDIQKGGCIIESESGIVDAQLDVQLESIENALLEGVNNEDD